MAEEKPRRSVPGARAAAAAPHRKTRKTRHKLSQKRTKKRKSGLRRLIEEVADVLEDVFD
jgi:hypothetical protein